MCSWSRLVPKPLSPQEALQLIALSLATDELRWGLDLLLSLSLKFTSDNEDFDLLGEMGYDDYDEACAIAAQAWIKRVTGMTEWSRATKPRDRKPI